MQSWDIEFLTLQNLIKRKSQNGESLQLTIGTELYGRFE